MNKIAIICPYFGHLPDNIFYTLESMKNNSFIDWYIFTDDNRSFGNYDNIHFVFLDFSVIKKIIFDKVGTSINSVYKLCDYKPLYGVIFDRYLLNYKFWGYCDLDMIFGNLNNFLSDDVLEKYDKIFDLGHFSIYRNCEDINYAYKDLKLFNLDYFEILSSDRIYVLDESYDSHISINELLENRGFKVFRNRFYYDDIALIHNNLYVFNNKIYNNNVYYFYDSRNLIRKIFNSNFEEVSVAYVHFQKRKFISIDPYFNSSPFYISPKKIGLSINKTNFYSFLSFRFIFYFKFRLKRFLNNRR